MDGKLICDCVITIKANVWWLRSRWNENFYFHFTWNQKLLFSFHFTFWNRLPLLSSITLTLKLTSSKNLSQHRLWELLHISYACKFLFSLVFINFLFWLHALKEVGYLSAFECMLYTIQHHNKTDITTNTINRQNF